jgi:uncharacterized protein (DUF4415 family)
MKSKMVSYTPETLPPLTDAQVAHLEALAARPDSEIDFSDIPELTAEKWKKGIRGRFYRPVKRQITARVDADVLEWLKSQGKGYSETRIGVTRSLGVQVDATTSERRPCTKLKRVQ